MTFSSISKKDVGRTFTVLARVEHIHQTSGPTLFKLFDGTAHFTAKAFVNPGERAFPKIEKGYVVEAAVRIQEYEGRIEGSIASMEYRDEGMFEKHLTQVKEAKIGVKSIPFLITSSTLEKLRERFESAASLLKQAVIENRPIILRHNADCDGYSGAVALERALLPLIMKHHNDIYAQWKYYKRAPSRAPFYAVSDSLNDLQSIANGMRKGGKAPLVIILDNGSGKEDLLGIKLVKSYGCPIVVVDHHFIDEDVISAEVDVHVNPYLVGGNSQICAGMLGAELARIVKNDIEHIAFLPALAGVGDRVESDEMRQYVEHAEKSGFSLDFLKKLSVVIDYVAYYIRHVEARGFIDDLFGADREKQEKVVELLFSDAQNKVADALVVAKHYAKVENGEKVIVTLDLSSISVSGEFPPFGKVTGIVSDWVNEKQEKPVYMLGLAKEMIILRVTKTETHFNLNSVITELQREKPYAGITGGGHERAGTIRCAVAARDDVLAFVIEYIKR